MQQGRFRATGMMNNHPHASRKYSVAILITKQVGHFWKADPGHFSKAPKSVREPRCEDHLAWVWPTRNMAGLYGACLSGTSSG